MTSHLPHQARLMHARARPIELLRVDPDGEIHMFQKGEPGNFSYVEPRAVCEVLMHHPTRPPRHAHIIVTWRRGMQAIVEGHL